MPSFVVTRSLVKKCGTEAYPTVVASVLLRDVPITIIGDSQEFFSKTLYNILLK